MPRRKYRCKRAANQKWFGLYLIKKTIFFFGDFLDALCLGTAIDFYENQQRSNCNKANFFGTIFYMERKKSKVIKNKVVSSSTDLLPKHRIIKASIDKTKYYIILKSLPILGDFLIASSDTHITVAEVQNNLARMTIGKNWNLLSTDEEIAKVNLIIISQYFA